MAVLLLALAWCLTIPAAALEDCTPYERTVVLEHTAPRFSDVEEDSPYRPGIDWAVEHQITNGTGDGRFSPDDTCTVAQILTFLWRAQGMPVSSSRAAAAADADSPYYPALCWASEKALFTDGDGTASCRRSDAVTYLWQLAGSPQPEKTASFSDVSIAADYAEAVAWAVEQGITSGVTDSTFEPESTCTRGEIVTFLYRAYANQKEAS